jgi:site-specific recombinase XerD
MTLTKGGGVRNFTYVRTSLRTPPMQIESLAPMWLVHLEAENLSPATLTSYRYSTDQLADFLEDRGMPLGVTSIAREHIEAFLIWKREQTTASTAATRYRGLQQFFRWLVEEGELTASPMARMKPPKVEEEPVAIIQREDLEKLFSVSAGRSFDDRRDAALMRLFLNTGARLGEMVGLSMEDVDLHRREIYVMGKGRKARILRMGPKATQALARYMRVRMAHPFADHQKLWIGLRGPMTDSGVIQMLRRRCRQAQIGQLHPHQFRHTFSHLWLASGGAEHDLATINGWASLQMVGRYAKSAATERAHAAHQRLAPGEDI